MRQKLQQIVRIRTEQNDRLIEINMATKRKRDLIDDEHPKKKPRI